MRKIWFEEAWEDYLYWQVQDKKTLRRINALIRDIERGSFDGIGKPEPLRGDLSGFCALMIQTGWSIASGKEPWRFFPAKVIMKTDLLNLRHRLTALPASRSE